MMCKLIKRIICLLMLALIVFVVIAFWSGGEKFRWFGKKTGGIVEDTGEKLGNKADEIKGKKDQAEGVLKKLTGAKNDAEAVLKKLSGAKNEANETSAEKSEGKASKPEKNKAETDENEATAFSPREVLKNIMDKIMGLIKR
ncbi:MAG: hypothetical protein HQL08_05420 [Nitrospirae bacterium]|nr:hypothetical protein [Nitrospirota bacterium]